VYTAIYLVLTFTAHCTWCDF